MTELEMLEEAVESEAVEAAPGAVEILPGLGLLSAVVVVQELVNYPGHLRTKTVTWCYGPELRYRSHQNSRNTD